MIYLHTLIVKIIKMTLYAEKHNFVILIRLVSFNTKLLQRANFLNSWISSGSMGFCGFDVTMQT